MESHDRLDTQVGYSFDGATESLAVGYVGKFWEDGMNLLNWAVTFFIVALIAALFGFGGIAGAAAGIAKILFFVFLILFLASLLVNFTRRT